MSLTKKFILILPVALIVSLVLTSEKSFAQGGEGVYLNGYASYVFDAGFDSYFDPGNFYDGTVEGGLQWGVGIEIRPQDEMGIELLWIRQDTDAPTLWADGIIQPEPRTTVFDVAMNYIMVGGNRHMPIGTGNVEGDIGIMAGAAVISATNPDTNRDDSITKFAWGLKGGVTIWTQGPVGIRMMAQLLSPVQAMGGGLYFGTGGGGVGVSSYSSLYQFSLGGGLVFKVR